MAIKNRKYLNEKSIHHSGRGFQYCNPTYTTFTESNGMTMCMTNNTTLRKCSCRVCLQSLKIGIWANRNNKKT
jgi:hypothetical protein